MRTTIRIHRELVIQGVFHVREVNIGEGQEKPALEISKVIARIFQGRSNVIINDSYIEYYSQFESVQNQNKLFARALQIDHTQSDTNTSVTFLKTTIWVGKSDEPELLW
jgi:hypothetical protein